MDLLKVAIFEVIAELLFSLEKVFLFHIFLGKKQLVK